MTVEALSSNVVNYLVWRYLQEAGYGNAALQLSRCWNRDPEALPFAKNVAQHTLINLLQDGLWFDKLQADASHSRQRYHFGADHGRPYSVRNGNLLTLDQGIPAYQLAEDEDGAVQEPPPRKPSRKTKKGAKTTMMHSTPTNPTDAMEVDVHINGNAHTNVTNSVRADSEAMVSEAESPTLAEIPISTLSIGQSTEIQTEQPADLAPNTMFECSVKEPDKVVTQTLWGMSGADASLLLAAGRSLLRLNLVPKTTGTHSTPPLDLKIPLENRFCITAVCWNSDGELTVSAQEEKTNERGETMKTDKLFRLIEGGSEFRVVSSTAGFVTTLRWNESKQLLLAISSDGVRGSIKVWKLDHEDDGDVQAAALTEFTETNIFDAVWTGDSTFAVGGMGIFHIYDVGEAISLKQKFDTGVTWENLKYDTSSGIIAATGLEGQTSHLAILHPSDPTNLQTHEYPDEYLADLDFRPQTKANGLGLSSLTYPPASSPVLLATCATSGVARVWDAAQPFKCLEHLPISDGGTFASNNIAFSPDGSLLATAGPDAVTVWDLEKKEVPLATWKSEDFGNDKWDSSVDGEFSLGWDPNSSRLSIALGNQVAIIPVPR